MAIYIPQPHPPGVFSQHMEILSTRSGVILEDFTCEVAWIKSVVYKISEKPSWILENVVTKFYKMLYNILVL